VCVVLRHFEGVVMNYRLFAVSNSILIFLIMIPLAVSYGTYGWIPDLFVFIGLTLFYYWTWDTFRLNLPLFTLLILGHILHAGGIFGWYHISPVGIQWDHITHFLGALPFAILFYRFMEPWMSTRFFTKKNLLILITIFMAATGVGAVVEISEFVGYLQLGFGDGAFMYGPGDGIVGLEGSDLVDGLGGGWVNAGWDFLYNTFGIIVGMLLMISIRLFRKKPEPAYYYEPFGEYSRKIE